jgi:DtxR family Mn-dependent transcriptional regulator
VDNPRKPDISASLEDYLEAIFWLVREQKVARSKDIAERLNVSKPSVTGALRQLTAGGYINYDPYRYVTLTEAGERAARAVVERHRLLADFLERVLRVDAESADANACRMEHVVGEDVLERLSAFMRFADSDAPDLRAWMNPNPKELSE